MTKEKLKSIQENIESIREVAMTLLRSSDSHMIELAEILSDSVMDIEMELYNPEPEDVPTKSYNSTSNRKDTIQYELASEEEQVEKWADAIDKIFKLKLIN